MLSEEPLTSNSVDAHHTVHKSSDDVASARATTSSVQSKEVEPPSSPVNLLDSTEIADEKLVSPQVVMEEVIEVPESAVKATAKLSNERIRVVIALGSYFDDFVEAENNASKSLTKVSASAALYTNLMR